MAIGEYLHLIQEFVVIAFTIPVFKAKPIWEHLGQAEQPHDKALLYPFFVHYASNTVNLLMTGIPNR